MESKNFFIQLIFVVMVTIILLYACYNLLPIKEYLALGIVGLIFFILLSILIFFLATKASKSTNLNAFTHLIMYNLMLKLFFSVIIVAFYYYLVKPAERLFIVPFVIIYLIFTIFEAMFLSRQARQKS